jgi:hypothetical protein
MWSRTGRGLRTTVMMRKVHRRGRPAAIGQLQVS